MKVNLRSEPFNGYISREELYKTIKQKNLCHRFINSEGGIQHEYELIKINGEKIVFDHATGLTWQRETRLRNYGPYFAGFNDWFLPNLEQSLSLIEPNNFVCNITNRLNTQKGYPYPHPKIKHTKVYINTNFFTDGFSNWTTDFGPGWSKYRPSRYWVDFNSGSCYSHNRPIAVRGYRLVRAISKYVAITNNEEIAVDMNLEHLFNELFEKLSSNTSKLPDFQWESTKNIPADIRIEKRFNEKIVKIIERTNILRAFEKYIEDINNSNSCFN